MGKTMIEKIIGWHTGGDASPGETVWLDVDVRTARDFGGPNVVRNLLKHYKENRIADRDKTFFTFDTVAPANNIPYAENQQFCRIFAREEGIKLFDVDQGIGTHVLIEEHIIRPGITAVGTDSHYNILGAVAAFGQGMGDVDIAFAFKTGKVWFNVPNTVRINLAGIPPSNVYPKDVVLFLLSKFGASGLLGRIVEIYGDYIDSLPLPGRITIASMGTEMGLISILLPPNDHIREFYKGIEYREPVSDPDAKYEAEYTFDISKLTPLLSAPFEPHNVHPVSEFEGKHIDTGFIGSCTNGRYEDIRIAADILRGKKIKDGCILKVVPATRRVYKQILKNGTLEELFDAGAIVSHARCSGCASGQLGMTGEGEVQLSTGNRNFKGKQGKGETFLASTATVAYSCLFGEIREPAG